MAPPFTLALLSFFFFVFSVPVSSFPSERFVPGHVRQVSTRGILQHESNHDIRSAINQTSANQTAAATAVNSTANGTPESTATGAFPLNSTTTLAASTTIVDESTTTSTGTVNPTTTTEATGSYTNTGTSSVTSATTASPFESSMTIGISYVTSGTAAPPAVSSTTIGTSSVTSPAASPTVNSTELHTSSVTPGTAAPPTMSSSTIGASSTITWTSSTRDSTSVTSGTTAPPTVSSTTIGTSAVNSPTTAPPTVNSTEIRTSSVTPGTAAPPTVSSSTTGASSMAIGTSSTTDSTSTASGTTTPPTGSSSTIGASSTTIGTSSTRDSSSVTSGTTAPPTVSSTTIGTSPVTSGTAAPTVSFAAIGTSINSVTTTVPSVSSTAIGTSVISSTTTAPVVSSTTAASSTVSSTTSASLPAASTQSDSSAVTSKTATTPDGNSTSVADSNLSSPCTTSGASPSFFRMNVGGGAITAATMGGENENYMARKRGSGVSLSDAAVITSATGPAPWDEAYNTYRWIQGSVLKYRIPVKPGTYTVKVLFAETVHMSANARLFDVFINGAEKEQALDVYASVGKDVGLLKEYTNITTSAFVEVAIIKVVDHPMLSGIIIEGPGAGAKAVGGGCRSSADGELELNNGFDHRAHAVPNGPYAATDLEKVGSAMVSIDGTLSHSHYSDPGPPEVSGHIVSYKWTWTEIVNGSEVMKEKRDRSGKFKARFPLGRTLVTLEVVDNTGDTASDYAEVDVSLSTKDGAYCYGYDLGNMSMSSIPDLRTIDWIRAQKPQYGDEKDQLLFDLVPKFGDAPLFQRSFMYRCTFFLTSTGVDERNFTIQHNGPFVLYRSGSVAAASSGSGDTTLDLRANGLHECEVLYFRDASVQPMFALRADDTPITAAEISHDESEILPVISRLSESRSARSGGANIRIFGSGFLSDVKIFFGAQEATNLLRMSSKLLQVKIPRGRTDEVLITVHTRVAVSNGIRFVYADPGDALKQPIIFATRRLQHPRQDKKQNFPLVASVVYGPDFRLYLGTYSKGHIHAVMVGGDYRLRSLCTHDIGEGRSALGLTFSPFRNKLRLYFSSSTVFWKKFLPFEKGWVNGKIESVDFSRQHKISGRKATGECSYNQQDVVTGLPVSAHDHSVNKLEFTPDGRLLITIGGFTNGGISIPGRKRVSGDPPDDRFGGVASNPFSAAIVSCPVHTVTRITYDNYTDPEKAKVVNGTACFVYASGIRNSFGMTLHSNGHIYVTDNGGSRGNGDFSTDCHGGSIRATKQRDKLFRVQRGGYHGHPNLNRGECVHYPPDAVQPIANNIESSTDGVMEYRSNSFGGQLKGNLLLTKFASNNRDGRISQVLLDSDGAVAPGGFIENLYGRSGLTVAEGPRGELVMPQVYQNGILFVYPKFVRPRVTFVIGVLPRRGPARGKAKVLVSGFGFLANSTVWFGDRECVNVRFLSDRRLTCWTPPSERRNQLVRVVVDGVTGRSPSYGSDYWYF